MEVCYPYPVYRSWEAAKHPTKRAPHHKDPKTSKTSLMLMLRHPDLGLCGQVEFLQANGSQRDNEMKIYLKQRHSD